jgi:uncharacterized protein
MGDRFDHNGLEILTDEECWLLLGAHHIGRLAVVVGNEPEIFPVNYIVLDGDDGPSVLFRSSEGTKLAGAVLGGSVAFEIDAADPLLHTGWSVVVRGRAVEIERLDELLDVEALPLRPWGPGEHRRYVRIVPEAVTGRRIVHRPIDN